MNGERERVRDVGEGGRFCLTSYGLGDCPQGIGVYFFKIEVGIGQAIFLGKNLYDVLLLSLVYLGKLRVFALGVEWLVHRFIITPE